MQQPQADQHTNPPPAFPDTAFDVVAIAASAGGLKALSEVLSHLPSDFPAAILVLQHLDRTHRSLMVDILRRRISLPIKQTEDGDKLSPGNVYIAQPNYHVLVNSDGTLSLTQSPMVNFVRPSADLLFESLAKSYQDRVIAVILTGTGKDGTKGLEAIAQMGGMVISQNQATSEHFGMPRSAIDSGSVNLILPLPEIAETLIQLVKEGRE
ncbi:MAG: chemotaxis protein CheB [Coleofasciculus sp. C1-SOL-03]|jgi:two-component system chemotaxis response regulator CheB|uniref:chemotaxis protein CheB n=1 Tax=Coleofasciculus sp. C1-SOL-03 TaxID=3069522 RepID=UPI0032F24D3D